MDKIKFFLIAGILISLGMSNSCTKLDEKVYDQIPIDKFGNTTEEINSLVAPIYRGLKLAASVSNESFFALSELSSDMAVNPTRKGGDGWENGEYKELCEHKWIPSSCYWSVKESWEVAYKGIGTCNRIYSVINGNTTLTTQNRDRILAEIRSVRAFWYYMLLDFYGNVPIVTDFMDKSLPETKSRKEVYQFVLSELNDIKNKVRSDVSSESYGKATKGFVYTLLAKMYLNAMVWNPDGGPKWQECINACDTILSLNYVLEPDWKLNFAVHNEVSREIIFPVIFSTADGGNYVVAMTLHYLAAKITFGLNIGTWNMVCAMPGYVKEYDTDDKRLGWSFLTGAMTDPSTGDTIITSHGRPLIHTVDITMKYSIDADGWGQVEQEDGARINKWEFEKGLSGDSENDYAIFRLADVYLMKAEALVRNNADNAEATRLVNEIRKRGFNDPSKLKSSVTLDDIYKERRFEFAWEITSRQDMIRFGTYLNAVPGWKEASPEKCLLFPIPTTAMDANNNLVQNPGY
jgi:starch-binding outer membrane protein, SusD/RagB family